VPLRTLESKMLHYVGFTSAPQINLSQALMAETVANLLIEDYFEISLIVLLNRVLEEWEHFQAQLRKKLLKKFIDFDANADGVLTLDEFRELMKSLEGGTIPNERVIMLFNDALEMSSNVREEEVKVGAVGSAAAIAGGGPDKMSPGSFVEAVIRNRIGGYGSEFLSFDFLNYEK
jgi:Ca2+-binding EF-hand superfamily protein